MRSHDSPVTRKLEVRQHPNVRFKDKTTPRFHAGHQSSDQVRNQHTLTVTTHETPDFASTGILGIRRQLMSNRLASGPGHHETLQTPLHTLPVKGVPNPRHLWLLRRASRRLQMILL
jgi:hypothetical protein